MADSLQTLHDAVLAELQAVADSAKAAPMQKYMKSAMPFLGVAAPQLRTTCNRVFAAHVLHTPGQWRDACLFLWRNAHFREQRHAAITLTGYKLYREFQTPVALPMYEEMIVTGAWWDYVDEIASHRLGPLLGMRPKQMRPKMLQWSRSKNMWKRRSAILCQLSFKGETDLPLLYECIQPSLDSPEFFLRKAIGWALRQYAWTDPREIQRYVKQHADRLSALSTREALKNIQKR